MIVHKKKIDNKYWKDCYAYTMEEATNLGISWKELRDEELSEYVKTDDDYIVKLKYKRRYSDRSGSNLYISTEFGSVFAKQRLIVKKVIIPYKEWKLQRTIKKREFPLVLDYVAKSILDGNPVKPQMIVNLLGIRHKNPNAIWRNMMSSPEVRGMIQKSLSEKLTDLNVDEGKVVKLVEEAIEMARGKDNPFAMLKAAELLGKYLGMDAKTVVKESHSTDGDGNISKILKEISFEG